VCCTTYHTIVGTALPPRSYYCFSQFSDSRIAFYGRMLGRGRDVGRARFAGRLQTTLSLERRTRATYASVELLPYRTEGKIECRYPKPERTSTRVSYCDTVHTRLMNNIMNEMIEDTREDDSVKERQELKYSFTPLSRSLSLSLSLSLFPEQHRTFSEGLQSWENLRE
jgi:hypothetical protein